MSPSEVKEACVQFVTDEKLPFKMFDSAPFKTLTEQIFKGLEMTPVTARNVMQHVSEKYEREKALLISRLKNKVVSLKIDIASRHSKGILGLNVQYYHNKAIEIKTLGVIELHQKHTGLNLSSEIENILADFSISKQQIYTITSDNGKNILKAIEHLNEDPESALSSEDENEELVQEVRIFSIASIRCAAHSLQLAVKDFLNNDERSEIVENARKLVKTLRTPTFRLAIAATSLPLPINDVPTRWSSTYEMLKSVCIYEEFIHQHLPPIRQFALLSVLEPISVATKKLQSEQLYFGDFFKLLLETKLMINSMSSNIHREDLVKSLESRENNLVTNEVILSAIYLDPRLRRIIVKNPIQLAAARNHLLGLMRKILAISRPENPIYEDRIVADSATSEASFSQPNDCPELTSQSTCSLLNDYLNSFAVSSGSEDSEDDDEPELKLDK
ncbi:uncharacterized protein LOC108117563 [Drosophila eugracilis]|uniref:uncharacterized protein LOC108117563 n=1 Tax=Drosophila eugracilis TaxID=29029 RepID=UPI0007E5E981|nr:uncharacterized protein LOC108117563 [Drosophila eugracilis]